MCGAAGAITVASRISMKYAPATSRASPRATPPDCALVIGASSPVPRRRRYGGPGRVRRPLRAGRTGLDRGRSVAPRPVRPRCPQPPRRVADTDLRVAGRPAADSGGEAGRMRQWHLRAPTLCRDPLMIGAIFSTLLADVLFFALAGHTDRQVQVFWAFQPALDALLAYSRGGSAGSRPARPGGSGGSWRPSARCSSSATTGRRVLTLLAPAGSVDQRRASCSRPASRSAWAR